MCDDTLANQNRFFIDFGVCPKALRMVLAAAGALFSLWRPVANNGYFGLHFGIILGFVVTIDCLVVTIDYLVVTIDYLVATIDHLVVTIGDSVAVTTW